MKIAQINRNYVNWTAQNLVNRMADNEAVFDIEVQRALVWNVRQKSLLIHSMVMDYPIPPLFCVAKDGKYEFIDGKQRANAIFEFVNNKFPLRDFPPVFDKDGNQVEDLNNKRFDKLPEEIQEIIKGYNLDISMCDALSKEQIEELFFRLNNGTSLKNADKNFAKSTFKPLIYQISQHDLFKKAFTQKAIDKMTQRIVVIQSMIMYKDTVTPSFDARYTRDFLMGNSFTEEDGTALNEIFTRILETITVIETKDEPDDLIRQKETKRIIRHILMKGNIPILVPLFKGNLDDDKLAGFLGAFFNGEKKATNNDDYNNAAGSGAGHTANIMTRVKILAKEFKKFKK